MAAQMVAKDDTMYGVQTRRSRSQLHRLLIHIPLFIGGFLFVFPFLWMIGSSLKTMPEFYGRGLNPFPGGAWQFKNYVDAWTGAKFSVYFFNTVYITVLTTLFTLLLASLSAFALTRLKLPFTKYFVIAMAVIMFLPHGYTILPVFEVVKALKLINTLYSVIIVQVGSGLVFNTFLIYGYMRTIPAEMDEAAVMDGANILQRFWNVILPLSTPILGSVGLFVTMGSWNSFFLPLVFTFSRDDLRTLAVGLYNFTGVHSTNWPLMAAGASISIVPVIIIYIFLQRYFVEAFSGAIKS